MSITPEVRVFERDTTNEIMAGSEATERCPCVKYGKRPVRQTSQLHQSRQGRNLPLGDVSGSEQGAT